MAQTVCVLLDATGAARLAAIASDRSRSLRHTQRGRIVLLSAERWIVEHALAWISRCRRLARDYERHARKAAAFVRLAMIRFMLRRPSTNP